MTLRHALAVKMKRDTGAWQGRVTRGGREIEGRGQRTTAVAKSRYWYNIAYRQLEKLGQHACCEGDGLHHLKYYTESEIPGDSTCF